MTARREQTATGSAISSLYMEPGRFLYGDGHTTSCRTRVRKTPGVRRVTGGAGTSQDAGSHMRQEGDVPQKLDAIVQGSGLRSGRNTI